MAAPFSSPEFAFLSRPLRWQFGPDMAEKWEFYLTRISHLPASVFVDVGIASDAPKEDYRVRLAVLVRQRHPRADGLTTQEEASRLWPLEDALVKALKGWGAIFVGRITTDGRRDFTFYGASACGFDATVSTAIASLGYEYETLHEADPAWSFYFHSLYPTPWIWQSIMNRHVLEKLKRGGDDLSKARRIFHWLYFSTQDELDRCAQMASRRGYGTRILLKVNNHQTNKPLGLQLHRIDSVATSSIDAVCQEFFTLAEENAGVYDGWETQIVKAGDEPKDDAPRD